MKIQTRRFKREGEAPAEPWMGKVGSAGASPSHFSIADAPSLPGIAVCG